ncbi:hypothetical protein J5N97_004762 [Dioscorea zingiberensis]|uniref:ABC transporter domain-containing protein n=1 Tax=Dioscorea zingiberensis TaxID=325984 RepID=A0A9D5D6V0_9LILI|nr:hypothetical protein J5N97_004762 [Dioscorea zingiberensis]
MESSWWDYRRSPGQVYYTNESYGWSVNTGAGNGMEPASPYSLASTPARGGMPVMSGRATPRSGWATPRVMAETISRSVNMSPWNGREDAVFSRATTPSRSVAKSPWARSPYINEDEEELRWAALERLPFYAQMRTAIIREVVEGEDGRKRYEHREVDVMELELGDRQQFIERLIKVAEVDNERFLQNVRARYDKVGIELPTVEVRFEHVKVKAKCYIGNRAVPTLLNKARDVAEAVLGLIGIRPTEMTNLTILNGVSGIIKPSRMTLLLGPPSSGKTTLLKALAGKLEPSLKTSGDVTYNGYALDEFVPEKTAAYISQNDVHMGEMTVRETLNFSARCQGVGNKYELLSELARREREAGIYPDPEIDFFMKATAVEGGNNSLQTDYTLRILGLDICADNIVGNEMLRGISGGEKKRVTTGEMIVGPTKTLFMDEISTGLDSSTTFQIVKCLQQIVHHGEATILMSLLQPAPETYELFDDIMLIAEGKIVYQGPREYVLDFFESCGFRCPERKGAADFLQEVTSWKDQEQYWADRRTPYRYVSVSEFAARFKRFHVGQTLEYELSVPFDKRKGHSSALVFSKYSVSFKELLKASFFKEWLLFKRNSIVYIFKAVQIVIIATICSTVFLRTRLHSDTEADGALYISALSFGLVVNMFNGFTELALVIARLPVFYKHRDLFFYPPWLFALPNFLIGIPPSIIESIMWVSITYFTIGFAPEASRFFKQMLLFFLIQQMASALFRLLAGICRSMVVSTTWGTLVCVVMYVLGGFILPREIIPKVWYWGYWISPLTYAYNALAVNEMFGSRWMNKFAPDGRRLGLAVLENLNIFPDENWYWIGAGGLLGFIILFNTLFTISLIYLNPLGKPQAVKHEVAEEKKVNQGKRSEFPRITLSLSSMDGNNTLESLILCSMNGLPNVVKYQTSINATRKVAAKRGMVLPFKSLAMSFSEVNYSVDMPAEMKVQGVSEERLQLLRGVTGAFRPGVLTALMGVSGAGKTTLMDVLAGRKTGGYIEGEIRISGYIKNQETFARISGYCEQNDVHSPQLTIKESLTYSAFLRLPLEVSNVEKMKFVDEVMELVELDNLKDAIVGLPGITGLSTEQRKRLTIAVELVANPSIIFMDEPTSGLDARAAAIVMRAVRNTVDTGRTVVCTIHQPSIDIFEAFDELLLMKRGGQLIYSGPLGRNSHKIIEYFGAIPGVPKFKDKQNPATWMLEASSTAIETKLGIDFAEHYNSSDLYEQNKALVEELSKPTLNSTGLYFRTKYAQPTYGQFKLCLWKHWWTYWRSPDYNYERFFFSLATGLLLGAFFWKLAQKRESSNNIILISGAMYCSVLFIGVTNCSTVQPVVAVERSVYYRERAAGMYSALSYAIAQVVVEIPYVFIQSLSYVLIVYSMMGFEWVLVKFFSFFFVSFISYLYFTYYGMMAVSISPNHQLASVFAGSFYSLFNLFAGFFMPKARIPKWWIWYYWICPVSWTNYGLIVSQYGDVMDKIKVPGQPDQPIKDFVKDHFGYNLDMMGAVAAILTGFAICFAFTFAYCIKKLNFQLR